MTKRSKTHNKKNNHRIIPEEQQPVSSDPNPKSISRVERFFSIYSIVFLALLIALFRYEDTHSGKHYGQTIQEFFTMTPKNMTDIEHDIDDYVEKNRYKFEKKRKIISQLSENQTLIYEDNYHLPVTDPEHQYSVDTCELYQSMKQRRQKEKLQEKKEKINKILQKFLEQQTKIYEDSGHLPFLPENEELKDVCVENSCPQDSPNLTLKPYIVRNLKRKIMQLEKEKLQLKEKLLHLQDN